MGEDAKCNSEAAWGAKKMRGPGARLGQRREEEEEEAQSQGRVTRRVKAI